MKAQSTAILFQCHSLDKSIVAEYKRISAAAGHRSLPFMLFHLRERAPSVNLSREKCYYFTDESLRQLCYPRIAPTVVPGSAHFPLLQFFLDQPRFRYYWFIEYDVRFSGDWRHLFEAFEEDGSDYLTCHIRSYGEEPKYCWWRLSHPVANIPLEMRYRSFNPIYRISAEALTHLHKNQSDGWCGHNEVLVATLLIRGGAKVRDFGGTGRFVRRGSRNVFYIDAAEEPHGFLNAGTMRYRPVFSAVGNEHNKLYHPIKPWGVNGSGSN